MVRNFMGVFFCLSLSGLAFAQDDGNRGTSAIVVPQQPQTARSKMLLGFKSTNDGARFETANNNAKSATKGKIYNGKQELFAGYALANGFGSYVQFTQYRQQFNDSSLDKWSVSDPSLSLLHPDFYASPFFKTGGLIRAYMPYTAGSKQRNVRQYAYYSNSVFFLDGGSEVSNQLIPRWFVADAYADTDTNFYVENRVTYSQKIGTWGRWGVANWSQWEQHSKTSPGFTSEMIPLFDFLLSKTVFVGPRILLPIAAKNVVYDGPTNATLEQGKLELYFQATL